MAKSPEPLEWELDVGVDDGRDCLVQAGFCKCSILKIALSLLEEIFGQRHHLT